MSSSSNHSILYGKSTLQIGASHFSQPIGFWKKSYQSLFSNSCIFGDNRAKIYIASLSVGTCTRPFNAVLCKPEMTDLLNQILYAVEKTHLSNREICKEIEKLCKSSNNVSEIAHLLQFLRSKQIFLGSDAYNILLSATSESREIELSVAIFKDILVSSKGMSSKSYFNVAKAFASTDDCSLLLDFVKEISQLTSHCGVLVLNRMIYAFAECRQIEKALSIFRHMEVLECKPDVVTYNTVIGLLGRAGMVDDMLGEFASMKRANLVPDTVTYNTLLNSFKKIGRLDLCLVYMREMDENGLIPDLRTYAALIESFGQSGNVEEALRLFCAMKRSQVRPSIYIYRSLINNLKKMGKLNDAASLIDEMNHSLPILIGPKDFKRRNR